MPFTDTIKKESQTNCLENRYLNTPSPQSKIGLTNVIDVPNEFSKNFKKNGGDGFTTKALDYANSMKLDTVRYSDGCAGFGG